MRRAGYIHPTAIIGEEPQDRNFSGEAWAPTIHPTACVEALAQVDAGTRRSTWIGPGAWVMKTAHVGHDAFVGEGVELTPGCVVSGFVVLMGHNRVGVGAVFKPFVMVGGGARIGAGSVVLDNVPPYEVWAGNPARRLRTSYVYEGGAEWQEVDLEGLAHSGTF